MSEICFHMWGGKLASLERGKSHSRASISYHMLTRAGTSFPLATRFHALYPNTRLNFMTSRMTSVDPVWPTWKSNPDTNRLKKKKEREKILWPNGPLTLTKKSKFSKRTCPTQFFKYIPILIRFFIRSSEIVQTSNFQKLTFALILTKCRKF